MKIRITKQDIAKGMRRNPAQCPLALRLRRRFPGKHIWVYSTTNVLVGGVHYKHTHGSRSFVRNFDQGFIMLPGTVILMRDYA